MWIMVKTKLPTVVSPPKMSIHWSTPWPNKSIAESQKLHSEKALKLNFQNPIYEYDEKDDTHFILPFGSVPNFARARAIIYKDEKIRVFPHEFSEISKESMRLYIQEKAIKLQFSERVASVWKDQKLSKGKNIIFDAALLDGCDDYEAMMVALGQGPSEIPPPIGWWKLREEYASQFCYEEEMVG